MNDIKRSTVPVNHMGRHEFHSFLYDLYECHGQNEVTADVDLDDIGAHRVEVFDSPDGVVVAIHTPKGIRVIGPVPRHIPDVDFVAATPSDEVKIRGAA